MNSLLSNKVKLKDSNMRLNYSLAVTTRIFEGIKLDDIDIISVLFSFGKSLSRNLINIKAALSEKAYINVPKVSKSHGLKPCLF